MPSTATSRCLAPRRGGRGHVRTGVRRAMPHRCSAVVPNGHVSVPGTQTCPERPVAQVSGVRHLYNCSEESWPIGIGVLDDDVGAGGGAGVLEIQRLAGRVAGGIATAGGVLAAEQRGVSRDGALERDRPVDVEEDREGSRGRQAPGAAGRCRRRRRPPRRRRRRARGAAPADRTCRCSTCRVPARARTAPTPGGGSRRQRCESPAGARAAPARRRTLSSRQPRHRRSATTAGRGQHVDSRCDGREHRRPRLRHTKASPYSSGLPCGPPGTKRTRVSPTSTSAPSCVQSRSSASALAFELRVVGAAGAAPRVGGGRPARAARRSSPAADAARADSPRSSRRTCAGRRAPARAGRPPPPARCVRLELVLVEREPEMVDAGQRPLPRLHDDVDRRRTRAPTAAA